MNYTERTDEFKNLLAGKLNGERYIHSLGVARCAGQLAEKYGSDKDKAYLCGLLHDVMKNESEQTQLQIIENNGIILTQAEKHNPNLWHAISGAAYLKSELRFEDAEFIAAVRYHTTGRAGMSLFEKIIYIADFISPERDYPDADVMRSLAQISLDEAALYSLKSALKRLPERNLVVHTDSVEFYNELIIQRGLK